WVNPTPRATPVNLSPAICYGDMTDIVLESPTVMTKGKIVYDYTVSVNGGTNIAGNFDPGTGLFSGESLKFQYKNNGDTIYSVFYSIVPRNDVLTCASGETVIQQVKLHPHPLDTMYLSVPFTCHGGSEGIITAVLSKGAKPDRIYWHRPSLLGDTTYYTSENTDDLKIRWAGYYYVTVHDSLNCTYTANPLFVSGAVFVSNISVSDKPTGYGTSCPGAQDGKIRIMEDLSSTGIPPYEFWLVRNHTDTVHHGFLSNKGDIYDVENLGAGIYTLHLRDANNCYDESYPEIEIYEPPEIEVSFDKEVYTGGHNVSCRGYNDGHVWVSSVSGGNPGGYKYKWYTYDGLITGPDTLDRLDDIPAGTYYLITSDIYCSTLDSVTLTQPEGMSLAEYKLSYTPDSAYNISCNGGSEGSIDITIEGGSGPYEYLWTDSLSFSSVNEDIYNLTAGTYYVEVKDANGCILKLQPQSVLPSFTLTEPDILDISAVLSSSDEGSHNINCNGGTGAIDITVDGGSEGSYQYSWSASDGGSGLIDGQEDQANLTAGRYYLEVTDLYGCTAYFDTLLTEPDMLSAILTGNNITCASPGMDDGSIDLTVSGGVMPYLYTWSNGETTEDISGLEEGNYIVTIEDANGCIYIDSIRIELPPPISFTTTSSDYNGYNISCFGYSDGAIDITLNSGSAPYICSWTGPDGFSATTEDISGLRSGEYIIMITDANFCTGTDTIELTEPGKLGMDIELSLSLTGGHNINCAGDNSGSIEVTPVNQVGDVNYLWSDGSTDFYRTALTAGNYSVIITDANGCHADSTVILTEPDSMLLIFNINQPWCTDKPDGSIELTVTGGVAGTDYSYLWSDGSTEKDIYGIASGWFSVQVTDLNGCGVTDSVFVEPLHETCLVIPNAISPNGDLINDYWNIGLTELYPEIEIKIFNRWGEEVWRSEKGYPEPWDGRSNGAILPIDSYHYIIDLHKGRKPLIGTITIVK
ncbi:MAG: T9SS type B sorting domain-containing protein, partial [Bacteroidetes bacterium]|nr:T9SS type B sorting domain-containing protein [Bacteroidota bacterium]